jgi:hypothetical protein
MTLFDTHLCLVSEQTTPNLLPVIDPSWRPRRVVLATTPRMQPAAATLRDVLRKKVPGLVIETLSLPDAYDYLALSDAFLEFLAENANAGTVALNVTGGTKLMAVAAQQVFAAGGQPVFYVNIDSDEVIIIGERAPSQPLKASLKVHEFLNAHGFQVEEQQRPVVTRDQRDLAARVIDHVGAHGAAMGTLNWLAASDSARRQLRAELSDRDTDSIALRELIGLFEQAGQVSLRGGRQLQFPNEASRSFVNGGWLELHALKAIEDLRGVDQGITDIALNLKLVHPDGKTKNEIDVAFLYRHTLHLLECKTANLATEGSSGADKATEALYKLEALRKIGGLRTRAMVLDYRGALSAHGANRDRARSAGIEIVAHRLLADLKGFIRRTWLK